MVIAGGVILTAIATVCIAGLILGGMLWFFWDMTIFPAITGVSNLPFKECFVTGIFMGSILALTRSSKK